MYVLYRFGPLCRVWSLRFEGKHKDFKQICRRTSYKNLLKTLTSYHQCRMAYIIQSSEIFASLHTSIGTASKLYA